MTYRNGCFFAVSLKSGAVLPRDLVFSMGLYTKMLCTHHSHCAQTVNCDRRILVTGPDVLDAYV